MAAAATVVDEYSLPDELKQAIRLSAPYRDTPPPNPSGPTLSPNPTPTAPTAEPEVFSLNGLVLTICGVPPSGLLDYAPTHSRAEGVVATEFVQRKMAGNELRNTNILQGAVERLDAQSGMQERVRAGRSEGEEEDPPKRASTLLSTVVDYAGFRVGVLCPAQLEEASLVYGPASVGAGAGVGAGLDTQSDAFVLAVPEVEEVLELLAGQLNLAMQQRSRLVQLDGDSPPEDADMQVVGLLTSHMQAHLGPDGRMYLLNLRSLMPSALPRAHTYDVLTHQLRPEFLLRTSTALEADIFLQTLEPEEVGAEGEAGTEDGADETKSEPSSFTAPPPPLDTVLESAQCNVNACVDLLGALPAAAHTLDSLSAMPLDSLGLTSFLHAYGLNVRLIGALYGLCRAPSARKLLLSEALARTLKALLATQLRMSARSTRAGVVRAEARGRSNAQQYGDYVEVALAQRRAAVLGIFNLVLGWGPKSDGFWQDTLCDALHKKFGIQSTREQLAAHLHWPQLLLAMQYHTGTCFQDTPMHKLCSHLTPSPFSNQALKELLIPKVRVATHLPGEVGMLFAMGDSLLECGCFEQAAAAFDLQYRALTAAFADAPQQGLGAYTRVPLRQQAASGHTLYKLALARYLCNDLAGAASTARVYVRRYDRYHPTTGRVLTLLMSCEYKMGNVGRALQLFDAAQEVYSYTLGPNHPIISMHMNCLGGLYARTFTYAGAGTGTGTGTGGVRVFHTRVPAAPRQARVLRLMACGAAKQSLGESHLVTVLYECHLGEALLAEGRSGDAVFLLDGCLIHLRKAVEQGAPIMYELLRALSTLSVALGRTGDVDRAGQVALQCLGVAQLVDRPNVRPLVASTYLHLSDLALLKGEHEAALTLLEQAWDTLKALAPPQSAAPWVGGVFAVLARRMLGLLVSTMSTATATMFESVAADWYSAQARRRHAFLHRAHEHMEQRQGGARGRGAQETGDAENKDNADQGDEGDGDEGKGYSEGEGDDVDDDMTVSTAEALSLEAAAQEDAWASASQAVFEAVWFYRPVEYFALLLAGIQRKVLSAEEEDETSQSGVPTPHTRASFPAQAAVISRMVKHQDAHTFLSV
ncbi:hypothetical protein B484DRAFT_451379 [Ochromonadaceae sp. CCMP2298]|nr:hypothetical protein B484DRAFT_451379 [Ochromonadaceae sp. CCMP2298]